MAAVYARLSPSRHDDCAAAFTGLAYRGCSPARSAPPEALWPGVEHQLKPRARRTPAPAHGLAGASAWWRRRLDLAVPQLAAAAVLLVLLSGGTMWLLLHGSGTRGPAVTGATPVAP